MKCQEHIEKNSLLFLFTEAKHATCLVGKYNMAFFFYLEKVQFQFIEKAVTRQESFPTSTSHWHLTGHFR